MLISFQNIFINKLLLFMCTSISRDVIFLLKISHLNVKDRCFAFEFILQLYHRIFSIKCLRHLFSFEAFRCSDYWKIVLKRRRHHLNKKKHKIYQNYKYKHVYDTLTKLLKRREIFEFFINFVFFLFIYI